MTPHQAYWITIIALCFVLFSLAVIVGVEMMVSRRLHKNDRYVWKMVLHRPPGSSVMLLTSKKVRK